MTLLEVFYLLMVLAAVASGLIGAQFWGFAGFALGFACVVLLAAMLTPLASWLHRIVERARDRSSLPACQIVSRRSSRLRSPPATPDR